MVKKQIVLYGYRQFQKIREDVETRFDTSSYELNRPLPTGKNKTAIGVMKDELGGKLMKVFVGLGSKAQLYGTNKNLVNEKEDIKCNSKIKQ